MRYISLHPLFSCPTYIYIILFSCPTYYIFPLHTPHGADVMSAVIFLSCGQMHCGQYAYVFQCILAFFYI